MRTSLILDRASPTALHRQIYDQWRHGILARRFRRGEKVPSTREVAQALAVSRTTVTAAYDQLIAEGYFDSARGSGTFVCRELPDDLRRPNRMTAPAPHEAVSVRLSRYGSRLTTDFGRLGSALGVIDLSQSGPDVARFPFPLWRRLITRHLKQETATAFDREDRAAGYAPLRREVAAYVARSRAVRCTPDQVIVVNGSQQALDLCVRLLLNPGDEVAVENPGYPGARHLFEAHGARLRPVPVTADGISVRDLPNSARLVYVTPSHQFPTGVSMSLARRLELIEWARSRGAALVEDDYDSEYRYSGSPLPAMQGLARDVPAIYVGTFSNVMFPSLRIGYLVAPQALIAPFTRAKWLSDRHTSWLEQAAVTDFLREGHLERHIRRMRRLYKRRRDVLIESLARSFGARVTIQGDAAGMHMLVGFGARTIVARAKRTNVQLTSAKRYYMSEAPPNEFVLGFSAIGERTIQEGIRRLAG